MASDPPGEDSFNEAAGYHRRNLDTVEEVMRTLLGLQ